MFSLNSHEIKKKNKTQIHNLFEFDSELVSVLALYEDALYVDAHLMANLRLGRHHRHL